MHIQPLSLVFACLYSFHFLYPYPARFNSGSRCGSKVCRLGYLQIGKQSETIYNYLDLKMKLVVILFCGIVTISTGKLIP